MARKHQQTGPAPDSRQNDTRRQETPPQPPSREKDDPTSAHDDPDLPDEESLIPTKADISDKEGVEYFTPSGDFPDPRLAEDTGSEEEDASPEIIPGTDADVTDEDLAALGPREEDMDQGEDESVRNKDLLVKYRDETSEEEPEEQLDVPGAELDDEAENRGSEDEENNEYSR